MAGRLVVNTLNTDTVGAVLTTQNGITGIAKAWVNYNGVGTTGGSLTIRGSFNVSSVIKDGTGLSTLTFTTAMPNTNYAVVLGGNRDNTTTAFMAYGFTSKTTTTISIRTSGSPAAIDFEEVCVAVFSS
jgi:hypothetical protein